MLIQLFVEILEFQDVFLVGQFEAFYLFFGRHQSCLDDGRFIFGGLDS